MYNRENIKKAFEKAGLKLEFAAEPFAGGPTAKDIFGIDIRRTKLNDARTEFFLMWPGNEDNSIVVRDVNKKFGQILLTVTEDAREFETTISKGGVKHALTTEKSPAKALERLLGRVIRGYPKVKRWNPAKNELVVFQQTPKGSRTFLMGLDERQIFMTQVDGACSTVQKAHDSLKTPTVTLFEGKAEGRTIRQGEWFFVNVTAEEEAELNREIAEGSRTPLLKEPIGNHAGRRGKPHTADELLVVGRGQMHTKVRVPIPTSVVRTHVKLKGPDIALTDLLHHYQAEAQSVARWVPKDFLLELWSEAPQIRPGREGLYVRGAVRHADHKTVKFNHWRRVIANAETQNVGMAVGGGSWCD